jgi:general secretion pathway protein G
MFARTRGSTRRGFTLIEMLIVIVIISVLALIVIPRLMGAGRKAKEAALRGDLHQIRNAIQQFEADCGVALDVKAWQGPYLRTPDNSLPRDPFTDSGTTWSYTASTGHVASGSTLTALNGEAYTSW